MLGLIDSVQNTIDCSETQRFSNVSNLQRLKSVGFRYTNFDAVIDQITEPFSPQERL